MVVLLLQIGCLGNQLLFLSPKTFKELQERQNYINENQNGINWYLSFKEPLKICEKNVNSSDESNY